MNSPSPSVALHVKGRTRMSVIQYLERQHREIASLLDALCAAHGDAAREELSRQLADVLTAHMVVEEELFYPAVRDAIDDAERIEEAFEEHNLTRVALRRVLDALAKEESDVPARVAVLRELVQMHLERESHELFPQVQSAMDGDVLENLLAQMRLLHGNAIEAGFEQLLAADIAEEPLASAARPVIRMPLH